MAWTWTWSDLDAVLGGGVRALVTESFGWAALAASLVNTGAVYPVMPLGPPLSARQVARTASQQANHTLEAAVVAMAMALDGRDGR